MLRRSKSLFGYGMLFVLFGMANFEKSRLMHAHSSASAKAMPFEGQQFSGWLTAGSLELRKKLQLAAAIESQQKVLMNH